MNLYEKLQVDPDATQQEIKDAYRDLAKETHPDKEGGDVEAFKDISKAYMVLSDTRKRKRYDETGIEEGESHTNNLANGLLQRMFNDILTKTGPRGILKINVVIEIKQQLNQIINSAEKGKKGLLESTEELEVVLGRVVHKSEQNVFTHILKNRIENNKINHTDLCQSIETAQTALVMIAEYEFIFDRKPEPEHGSIQVIRGTGGNIFQW